MNWNDGKTRCQTHRGNDKRVPRRKPRRPVSVPSREPGVSEDDVIPGPGGDPIQETDQHGYTDDEDQREMNVPTPRDAGASQYRAARAAGTQMQLELFSTEVI